jgi:5-bromo-4-chloroindolyl phosphate hydrolysis protein
MLDVHPPPHAAHGWRDFFVHIATIVIGLLIALGLEQSAEGIHHWRQLAEARDVIAEERAANQREFATATEMFRRETKRFQTNLAVLQYLQEHPGAGPNT